MHPVVHAPIGFTWLGSATSPFSVRFSRWTNPPFKGLLLISVTYLLHLLQWCCVFFTIVSECGRYCFCGVGICCSLSCRLYFFFVVCLLVVCLLASVLVSVLRHHTDKSVSQCISMDSVELVLQTHVIGWFSFHFSFIWFLILICIWFDFSYFSLIFFLF